MTRPQDWSALGWGSDPVPGDPGTVATVAGKYRTTADAVSQASANLARLDMSENKSLGLATVLDQIKAVRTQLDDVESRVDGASAALEYYGPRLGEAQQLSLEALSEAEAARQAARASQTARDDAASDYYSTNDPAQREAAKDQYNKYNGRVTTANHDLAVARKKLRRAIEERDEAAKSATDALQSIDQSSPVHDTAWDHIQEFMNTLVDFWDKYVAPHLNTICKILDIASLVLTVISIVLLVSGVGAPAGAALMAFSRGVQLASTAVAVASTAIAATKLVVSGMKSLTGRQSAGEFIKDSAVFGIGLGLGKLGMRGINKQLGKTFAYSTLTLNRVDGMSRGVNYVAGKAGDYVKGRVRDALGHDSTGGGSLGGGRVGSYRVETCGASGGW